VAPVVRAVLAWSESNYKKNARKKIGNGERRDFHGNDCKKARPREESLGGVGSPLKKKVGSLSKARGAGKEAKQYLEHAVKDRKDRK